MFVTKFVKTVLENLLVNKFCYDSVLENVLITNSVTTMGLKT
jgi:hypothetical protein